MREGNCRVSPRLIKGAGFDFKLQDPQRNREHTAAFMAKGTEPFTLPGYKIQAGYTFRRSLSGDQIRLMFDGITAYYVKLSFQDGQSDFLPPFGHITQVGVWRARSSRHLAAVTGLAALLFDWLVTQYTVVISDSEQTEQGKRFWQYRLTEALETEGRYLYAWDGNEEDAAPVLVTDESELVNVYEPLFWGRDPDEHGNRLFIITSKPLQAAQ